VEKTSDAGVYLPAPRVRDFSAPPLGPVPGPGLIEEWGNFDRQETQEL
jgi:hypothetical protein